MGPGYLESVYEEALTVELELRGIPFDRQKGISVDYKGHAGGGACWNGQGGKVLVDKPK